MITCSFIDYFFLLSMNSSSLKLGVVLCLNQPAPNPQVSVTACCIETGKMIGGHACSQIFYKEMLSPVFHRSR